MAEPPKIKLGKSGLVRTQTFIKMEWLTWNDSIYIRAIYFILCIYFEKLGHFISTHSDVTCTPQARIIIDAPDPVTHWIIEERYPD